MYLFSALKEALKRSTYFNFNTKRPKMANIFREGKHWPKGHMATLFEVAMRES
jgi:hypothetical protein